MIKNKKKKVLFGLIGAAITSASIVSFVAACTSNKQPTKEPEKEGDNKGSTIDDSTKTINQKWDLSKVEIELAVGSDIATRYPSQFEKNSLVVKYDGKTYDYKRQDDGFLLTSNVLKVKTFEAKNSERKLVVVLEAEGLQKQFEITGFKEFRDLNTIITFEEGDELSSDLEEESLLKSAQLPTNFIQELDVIKSSLKINGTAIPQEKFEITLSQLQGFNDEGNIAFQATVRFKDAEEGSADKSKVLSKIFLISGFKIQDQENEDEKKLDGAFLRSIITILKNEQDKNTKLASQITQEDFEYKTLTTSQDDETTPIYSDIDSEKYEITTDRLIADDLKGQLIIYFTIKYKVNPQLPGRTKQEIASIRNLMVPDTSSLVTYLDENTPYDYEYDRSNFTLDKHILDQNLNIEDFFLWFDATSGSNAFRRQMGILDLMSYIYSVDPTFKLVPDYPNLLKRYAGYFSGSSTERQGQTVVTNKPKVSDKLQSRLNTALSTIKNDKNAKETYNDVDDLFINTLTKIFPLVRDWSLNPKEVDGSFSGRSNSGDIGDLSNNEDTFAKKNNVQLFDADQILYVPSYREFTRSRIESVNATELELFEALVNAKKQLTTQNNEENQQAYNAALEKFKQVFYVSDNFELNTEKEYFVAKNKYVPNQEQKPRIVLKEKVIEKWKQDKKPILITSNGAALKNYYYDLKYLTPQFPESTPSLTSELTVNNEQKTAQFNFTLSNPTTVAEGNKVIVVLSEFSDELSTVSNSPKYVELERTENGSYSVTFDNLLKNRYYRITFVGQYNPTALVEGVKQYTVILDKDPEPKGFSLGGYYLDTISSPSKTENSVDIKLSFFNELDAKNITFEWVEQRKITSRTRTVYRDTDLPKVTVRKSFDNQSGKEFTLTIDGLKADTRYRLDKIIVDGEELLISRKFNTISQTYGATSAQLSTITTSQATSTTTTRPTTSRESPI